MNANNESDKNKFNQSKTLWTTKPKFLSKIGAQNNIIQITSIILKTKLKKRKVTWKLQRHHLNQDKQPKDDIAKSNTEGITNEEEEE